MCPHLLCVDADGVIIYKATRTSLTKFNSAAPLFNVLHLLSLPEF